MKKVTSHKRLKRLVEQFAIIMIALALVWYFLSGIPTDYSQEENRPSCYYEDDFNTVIENGGNETQYK